MAASPFGSIVAEPSHVLRWETPPPAHQHRRPPRQDLDHVLIAALLRSRPREWALIPTSSTGMAGQIKRGDLRAYRPAGSFEAVRRDGDGEIRIWARYVGQDSSS